MNVLPAGAAAWVGKARCELQPPFPSCSPARFLSRDLGAQPSQPCLSPHQLHPPLRVLGLQLPYHHSRCPNASNLLSVGFSRQRGKRRATEDSFWGRQAES